MIPEANTSAGIAAAAATWIAKHDRGFTPAESAEFRRWKAADPRHAEEWESMADTWSFAQAAKGVPGIAAAAAALEESTRTRRDRGKFLSGYGFLGMAAAAVIAVGIFLANDKPARDRAGNPPAVVYRAAEANDLQLPDGSVISVRGNSHVTHDFSGSSRRVQLGEGEAFFTVAHDSQRPFVVEIGNVSVRAVGTAFNVRRENGGVDVLVTQGGVQVAGLAVADTHEPLILQAGHTVRVGAKGEDKPPSARSLTPLEIEGALKWRSPLLELRRAPLSDVLAAFAQHSGYRIELGDPALAQRIISGTFQADNADGFLRLAELSFGMTVQRDGTGRVILHPAR